MDFLRSAMEGFLCLRRPVEAQKQQLRLRPDGTFKIVQLTDVHFG